MIWTVPKIWEGGECFIIGGGPSLTEQLGVPEGSVSAVCSGKAPPSVYEPYLKRSVGHRHIIGVNNAYMIAEWIDIVFFGDCQYWLAHRNRLASFSGLKVTSCNRFQNRRQDQMEGIKYLPRYHGKKHGISEHPNKLCWNNNSGGAAISLAALLGVRKIYLLGYDMCENLCGTHWHGSHAITAGTFTPGKKFVVKKPPFEKHLEGFPAIARDAERMGIEIINVSPASKINCFPKRTLVEVLHGE